jgi:hypothetical protein
MDRQKTVVLGAEYDQGLRERLGAALSSLGAEMSDSVWGVGGSQELMRIDAAISDRILHIEAETYIGLSVTGDEGLVDLVVSLIERKADAP